MTSLTQAVADEMLRQSVQVAEQTPTVRGGDWQTAVVTAVASDGTVTAGGVTARRLDTYQPAVGDLIELAQASSGAWLARGRLVGESGDGWLTPTFTSPWINYAGGGGFQTARYRKYPDGDVAIDGLVATGGTSVSGSLHRLHAPCRVPAAGHPDVHRTHGRQRSPADGDRLDRGRPLLQPAVGGDWVHHSQRPLLDPVGGLVATTDDYSQGVSVTTLTDAPDAETLAKNIANGIVSRSVLRFASASARTTALTGPTAPVEGMTSWLQDVNRLYIYDGTVWRQLSLAQSGTVNISFTNLDNYSGTTVTFASAFAVAPRVFVNINSGAAPVARWTARAIDITTTNFKPFVFASVGGNQVTWAGIEVQWYAIAP
ncbi:H-type lectin domain-containing protein [Streptomyces sp. S1A(2023)]